MDTGGKSPDLPAIQGAPPDLADWQQMRMIITTPQNSMQNSEYSEISAKTG